MRGWIIGGILGLHTGGRKDERTELREEGTEGRREGWRGREEDQEGRTEEPQALSCCFRICMLTGAAISVCAHSSLKSCDPIK